MARCDSSVEVEETVPVAPGPPAGQSGRRAYRRPELVQYGSVRELTRTGSTNANMDILMMAPMNM